LDDKIHGGLGDDVLYGEGGEDTIWGDEGMDVIKAGYGWDTIFGGPGCDTIYAYDGGDVIWLGDCEDDVAQKVYIYGTGRDPENFTVIMDFWLEGAKPWNMICPRESKHQAKPAAGACAAIDNSDLCFGAADLFSPGTAHNVTGGNGRTQGPGCKHDGGPLWISIPLEDDPVVAKPAGGAPYSHTVWMRVY